mmetsp:Transcript_122615/g.281060  ORF Transcript_122615/g.281060 Transcript_122615/m.281060 type:complete len:329 (-) Transcript_122615:3-989(-)
MACRTTLVEATSTVSQQQLQKAVLDEWIDSGYLDPTTFVSGFGSRSSHDAAGIDIGSTVPLYTLDGGVQVLSESARKAAIKNLQESGLCLLKNAVDTGLLERTREALQLDMTRATHTGQALKKQDPNVWMSRFTTGRLHCLLRGTTVEDFLHSWQTAWLPVVHEYLSTPTGKRLFLSEIQLIVVDPLAENETYHCDNRAAPALSVYVPLVDASQTLGGQQVLPGSHTLFDGSRGIVQRVQGVWRAICKSRGPIEFGTNEEWRHGDALLLDSRTIHRATQNDSFVGSAVVVFRYDFKSAPPGSASSLAAASARVAGSCISRVYWLLSKH